jgi:sugar phosphate permease
VGGLTEARPAGWIGLVAVVTAIQAVLALMTRALPLFGLPLTLAAGVPPAAVGQLAAATSFGSMVFFLWGPALAAGLPALRQLQAGSVLAGVAVLLCLSDHWGLILLAAFLIGVGYGPSAPAGSDLLMRAAPPARRALAFSVKQAGVPLGGLVAGLALPAVAIWGGVGMALWLAALIAVAAAAALGLWRRALNDPAAQIPTPGGMRCWRLLGAPARLLKLVLGSPELRTLTVAGLGLGAAQGVVMGYFPVFLSDHAGWSLAAAGAAFALLQGVGIGGRILMGWLSDRLGAPGRTLGWLCVASATATALVATIGPESPVLWIAFVAALAGLTIVSWNGVFLSHLASAAPAGRVGEATSAATFVLFASYVAGPLIVQAIVTVSGGYAAGFLAAGAAPLVAATIVLRRPA